MKFIKRDGSHANADGKRFGGGSKPRGFGVKTAGFSPRGGGYGDRPNRGNFEKPQLHEATCAGCGKQCGVPFRPNGSKPVYCSLCFKRDEAVQEGRPSRPSFAARPSFGGDRGPRPPYVSRPRTPYAEQRSPESDAKMNEINMKLDRILRELEALKGRSE